MTKKAKCYLCDKELEKNEVGLSKKLLGRNITRYYCISCLADYLDISVDDLLSKIEEFKEQGCRLFS
ncbi:MAG: hypothetical protein A4E55_02303 [Pelotomaculum sp. PtaU1.Bin035]|nr:MAG: hypothetical protein A4E55_02303 [Pelotomaculum sp. PtaU1.Bin035]